MLTIRIKIILSSLIITTVAAAYVLARFSSIEDPLLPREKSAYPWRISPGADLEDGGASSIALKDSAYHLNIDFNLAKAIPYPYVTLGMTFDDTDNKHLEDWSSYSSMLLRIKCQPANVLNLALLTYDEDVTQYSRTFAHFVLPLFL